MLRRFQDATREHSDSYVTEEQRRNRPTVGSPYLRRYERGPWGVDLGRRCSALTWLLPCSLLAPSHKSKSNGQSGSYESVTALVAAGLVLSATAGPVGAQTLWTADGVVVASAAVAGQPVASTPLAAVGLSAGQAVVAWNDVRVSTASPGLYAQKLGGAGAALWGLSGASIAPSDPASLRWHIRPFSDGGTGELFAWIRSGSTGTLAGDGVMEWADPQGQIQRADANGTTQWGSPFISTAARHTNIHQTADAAGNSFIAVRKYSGAWTTFFLQKISPAATRQWGSDPAGVVVDKTFQFNNSVKFKILPDGSGGAYLFWNDTRDYFINNMSYSHDVFMAHVTSAGSLDWSSPKRISTSSGDETLADADAVIGDGLGGFLVLLNAGRLQRIDAQGTPLWGAVGVTLPRPPIQAAPDGSGGAYALWQDGSQGYVYWIKSDGNAGFASPVSVSTLTVTISNPVFATDGIGGVFAAWADSRNGNYDIFAQHISTDGTRAWGESGLAVCAAAQDQLYPALANVSTGSVVVAWIDQRNVGNAVPGSGEVFAQALTWNPATALPVVSGLSPTLGSNTGSVTVALSGSGFLSGITAVLRKAGSSDINGTGLVLTGSTQLEAQFNLTGATPGSWNLILTNPGGAASILSNAFLVTGSFSVTQVAPASAPNFGISTLTVQGAGFLSGANLYLAHGGFPNINPYRLLASSATEISAEFNLRGATTTGNWDIVVVNPDLSARTLAGGLTVTALNQISSLVVTVGTDNQIGITANGANIYGMNWAWLSQATTRQYAAWLTSSSDLLTYDIVYSSFNIAGLAGGWWDFTLYHSTTAVLITYPQALYISSAAAAGIAPPFARKRALSPGLRDGINDTADFPGAESVSIYDLQGRLIFKGNSPGASSMILWDGTDGAGRVVESGVYIAAIRMTDHSARRQAILVAK